MRVRTLRPRLGDVSALPAAKGAPIRPLANTMRERQHRCAPLAVWTTSGRADDRAKPTCAGRSRNARLVARPTRSSSDPAARVVFVHTLAFKAKPAVRAPHHLPLLASLQQIACTLSVGGVDVNVRLPEKPHSGRPIVRCAMAWMPASASRWQSSAASGSFAATATTLSLSARTSSKATGTWGRSY